jgi:hypothetical protein
LKDSLLPTTSPSSPRAIISPFPAGFAYIPLPSISFASFQIDHPDQSPDPNSIEDDRDIEMQCCETKYKRDEFKCSTTASRESFSCLCGGRALLSLLS